MTKKDVAEIRKKIFETIKYYTALVIEKLVKRVATRKPKLLNLKAKERKTPKS